MNGEKIISYWLRCILIAALLWGFFESNAFAQESVPLQQAAVDDSITLGLHDAIFLALERNPTVTIQRLDPKIAKSFADEQRARFDPVLIATSNKSDSKSSRFLGSRPDPFDLATQRSQYNVELSETLPTGTTVAITSSFSATNSSIYRDQYVGSMGITFSQALLQGIGWGTNLANLRRARLDLDISNAELKGVAEQVVADVETAYWTLYLAAQEINIQQRSLALADKQLQESLERVAVGKLPELELAAVHAEVSTRNEALINAQSRYDQARLRLIFLLNPDHKNIWSITPRLVDTPFVPIDSIGAVAIHEELGLKYRSDLHQANFQLKKGELEITRTRNGLLPRLDLFVSLGRTAYAQTFNEGLPDYKSPFYDATATLSFQFPVINRSARAEAARARWSFDQLNYALENMKRLVQWDVRSAYIEVLRTQKLIETTKVTLVLQDKKQMAELEKFRVGKSTNYLVLQAQRDYIASQLDQARAIVSHLTALINLYQMEGTLLSRRGISNLSP